MFQRPKESTFVIEAPDRTKSAEEMTWESFLEEGEHILWHGRPNAEKFFSPTAIRKCASGIPFIIFGGVMANITWPRHGNFEGMAPIFVIEGALILLGLYLMISAPFRDRKQRSKTWYTLTNKRAVIATDWRAKQFVSYPVSGWTEVFKTGGELKSIYFAQTVSKDSDGDGYNVKHIGFEMVPDGDKLLGLFNEVEAEHS